MKETQPILDASKYVAGALPEEGVVRTILAAMSKPVHLLDVDVRILPQHFLDKIKEGWVKYAYGSVSAVILVYHRMQCFYHALHRVVIFILEPLIRAEESRQR